MPSNEESLSFINVVDLGHTECLSRIFFFVVKLSKAMMLLE